DPGDEDDGETQHERKKRWPEMPEGKPQLTSGANPFRRRDLDVDDQERERDGKDGIAESLEPCVGVRVCHVVVVSVYGVGDPEPRDRRNEAMNRSFVSGSQTYYLTHQRASSLSSRATAKPVEQKFTCAVFLLHRHGVPHGVPGATLTRLPNRPSFSPFGPA